MGHAPENTRASFEAGLRLGAGAVECDVHRTKDGRLVVISDPIGSHHKRARGCFGENVTIRPWMLGPGLAKRLARNGCGF